VDMRSAGGRLVRAAVHVAAWSAFLVSVADSLRGGWHAVGDGALIALGSWETFSRHIPLVGQPDLLQSGLHDLGPAEYWLLAVPVHLDPARGQVWGAALLCATAASLAIEAAWAVLGPAGGLLASGAVLALIAWMPALAVRPYWNPYFGEMWFLAAVATAWAVMSGRRGWWPVLVVSASIAAQSHSMFALGSVVLALVALIVALADGFRAGPSYRWLVAGLFAGELCWLAPFDQQFLSSPGNMSALIQAELATRHVGPAFAAKALTAFAEPPPLWWQQHLAQRLDLYQIIETRPASFAVVVLAITAAVLLLAVFKLRSRWLASLAAVSLLVSLAGMATFSGIPPTRFALGRLPYFILAMFPAGLLIWLTAAAAIVLAGWQLISRRLRETTAAEAEVLPQVNRSRLAGYSAPAAAAVLVVLASLLGLAQASGYPGAGENSAQVGVAARLIDRALPGRRPIALSVTTDTAADRYRVKMGLLYALTAQGYDPDISGLARTRPIPRVAVLVTGSRVSVDITPEPRRLPHAG
jgi:hypothetical protein